MSLIKLPNTQNNGLSARFKSCEYTGPRRQWPLGNWPNLSNDSNNLGMYNFNDSNRTWSKSSYVNLTYYDDRDYSRGYD